MRTSGPTSPPPHRGPSQAAEPPRRSPGAPPCPPSEPHAQIRSTAPSVPPLNTPDYGPPDTLVEPISLDRSVVRIARQLISVQAITRLLGIVSGSSDDVVHPRRNHLAHVVWYRAECILDRRIEQRLPSSAATLGGRISTFQVHIDLNHSRCHIQHQPIGLVAYCHTAIAFQRQSVSLQLDGIDCKNAHRSPARLVELEPAPCPRRVHLVLAAEIPQDEQARSHRVPKRVHFILGRYRNNAIAVLKKHNTTHCIFRMRNILLHHASHAELIQPEHRLSYTRPMRPHLTLRTNG